MSGAVVGVMVAQKISAGGGSITIGNNTADDYTDLIVASGDTGTSIFTTSGTPVVSSQFFDTAFFVRLPTLSGKIAGGSTISLVEITYTPSSTPSAGTLTLHKMERNWVVGEAGWSDWSTGNAWTTSGGRGAGDCEAGASATESVAASTSSFVVSDATLISQVQDYLDGNITELSWRHAYTANYLEIIGPSGTDGSRISVRIDWT